MLKKIIVIFSLIFSVSQVQAFDRDNINLAQSFWGTWGIFNPKVACSENYQFIQPGKFIYHAKNKKLDGEFAIIRLADKQKLDQLLLDIQADNGGEGCGGDNSNYKGQTSSFHLKWLSNTSAELCLDPDAKSCLGLYFNRK